MDDRRNRHRYDECYKIQTRVSDMTCMIVTLVGNTPDVTNSTTQ